MLNVSRVKEHIDQFIAKMLSDFCQETIPVIEGTFRRRSAFGAGDSRNRKLHERRMYECLLFAAFLDLMSLISQFCSLHGDQGCGYPSNLLLFSRSFILISSSHTARIIVSHIHPTRYCLTHLRVLDGRTYPGLRTDFASTQCHLSFHATQRRPESRMIIIIKVRVGLELDKPDKKSTTWSLLYIIWTIKKHPGTSHSAGYKARRISGSRRGHPVGKRLRYLMS
jgi:hypothetical protein